MAGAREGRGSVCDARREYEEAFRRLVGSAGARAFSRGRHALVMLLKALGVAPRDRVGVCGFTCVSAVAPVKLCGAKPVYLDVDEHGCIDPEHLARRPPGSFKAVILQHTWGVPGRLDELVRQCRRIGARVVEDCALALGSSWNGAPLGSFGDGAIYSFGWGKPYTTGWGGMLTVNDESLLRSVDAHVSRWALPERALPELSFECQRRVWAAFVKARREVLLDLGYPDLCRWGLIGSPVEHGRDFRLRRGYVRLAGERTCRAGLREVEAWPGLMRTRRENAGRIERRLTGMGLSPWPVPRDADVTLVAYPILTDERARVLAAARRRYLDVIGTFDSPVYPLRGGALRTVDYTPGSCHHAERLARHLVCIPTASTAMAHTLEHLGAIGIFPCE